MDPTTEMTLNNFFSQAPLGQMDVTMAGDAAAHRLPASLSELSSFVAFNDPGQAVSLNFDSVLDNDGGIDFSSLQGPAESGPQVRGPNHAMRKPSGPGGMG